MIHPSLRDALRATHIRPAPHISARLGIAVMLISEVGQLTGSFKLRAAFNVAASVDHPRLLAASSGNFGQALAYAGKVLGKPTTIVMPDTSARVKIAAVRGHGARVELIDVRQISRAERVAQLAAADPDAYVASAYDDPLVIAGNSTLGEEIAGAALGLDRLLVPVGGGGLSAGVITGLCACGVKTPVWGAEPQMANDAARSLRLGRRVINETEPQTIADGARTVSVGAHNWQILSSGMPHIVEVPETQIASGMRLLATEGIRVEPTGALSVGALLTAPPERGARVGCILSGGNVDEAVYQRLIAG